jgi:cell division protein FtsQ
VSALTRDPLAPAPPGQAPGAAPAGWPSDPGAAFGRPGADFDPLREAWPALMPPAPPSRPPEPAPAGRTAPRAPVPAARPAAALALPPEPRPVRDVAPSRLSYRLHRLWLTPAVRRFVRHGLPVLLMVGGLAAFWAGEERRAMVTGFAADLRAAIDARPEFRIDRVEVVTDTPEVAAAVLARLGVELPASSLRLDLVELRSQAEALDAVARASLTVRTGGQGGGVLEVRLTERVPALVWRHAGGLDLIDEDGRRVARVASRAVRADLPLIAGEGAAAAIAEARQLLAAATPIAHRMVGLVRVGERRWDVVLDRDQRILLPAQGAVAAFERALALDSAQDLLSRDIAVVDLRNPHRTTLRLTPDAAAELARIRQTDTRMATR